jgi:hypothetical protein
MNHAGDEAVISDDALHCNFCGFQVTVTATDRGTPQQSDSTTITINLIRNTQSPVFTSSGQYATTIAQSLNVGGSVFTVTATDGDNVVSQAVKVSF